MALYPAKEKLAAGKIVCGTMLTECLRPEMVTALAASGVDFFIIDTEHSPGDLHEIEALVRASRQFGIAPLVRITDNASYLITRVLDCGAAGVVAPRVDSAEEARRIVDAVKYPPQGRRGFGMRGIITDFRGASTAESVEASNRETIVVIQVESGEALENLDKIVAVPGIDATMIGPQDLSISLGVPGQLAHAKLKAAYQRVVEVCQRSSVAAGIHMGDAGRLNELRGDGYRLLAYSTDLALMMKSLKEGIEAVRGAGAAAPTSAGMY